MLPIHHHRRRIILLILCLMLLHIAEIWIFGLNYFWLQYMQGFGEFVGFEHLGIFDCVYYSAGAVGWCPALVAAYATNRRGILNKASSKLSFSLG